MKKSYIACLLAAALSMTVLLSACGDTPAVKLPEEGQVPEKSQVSEEQVQEQQPSQEQTSIFWDSYEQKYPEKELFLCNATPFQDGAAWITVGEKGESYGIQVAYTRQTMLINTEGQVLYAFPREDSDQGSYSEVLVQETTPFMRGVCVVTTPDDQLMINTQGQVVWSVSQQGNAEAQRLFGEGGVEEIEITHFNGYAAVRMDVNTFEVTQRVYGFLKPDGTWIMEPGIHEEGEITSIDFWPDRIYAVVFFRDPEADFGSQSSTFAFNLETGEMCPIESGSTLIEYQYYRIYTGEDEPNGSDFYMRTLVPLTWQYEMEMRNNNGMVYLPYSQCFADADGNIVIDLSKYEFVAPDFYGFYPVFHEGYCFLPIRNPSGAPYFTVINAQGEEMFPPVKFPKDLDTANGIVSDGRLFIMKPQESYYRSYYEHALAHCYCYDLNGQSIEYDKYYCSPFSDGLQVLTNKDPNQRAHDYYYRDVNGEDPFPQ